jgi:hypothetical protein
MSIQQLLLLLLLLFAVLQVILSSALSKMAASHSTVARKPQRSVAHPQQTVAPV